MQAPWYFGATTPTLRHQRGKDEPEEEKSDINNWYTKGVKRV